MRRFLVFVFERDIAIEVQETRTVECYKNSLRAASHPHAAPAPSSRVLHDPQPRVQVILIALKLWSKEL